MTVHSSRLTLRNEWRNSNSNGVSNTVEKQAYLKTVEFTDGDGDNEAEAQYTVRGTIAPNADASIDVAGGITDVFGATLTFATIKELTLVNRNETAGNDLVLGGGSSPTGGALMTAIFDGDATSGLRVKAGGFIVLCAPLAGYAVTGGSADIIRIFNDGADAVEYDLILKGTV